VQSGASQSDLVSLPSLSSIELGEHHAWEAGSHFLPRRYSMGERQHAWIWAGAALSIALFVIVAVIVLFTR
jgi:hypothetical protein